MVIKWPGRLMKQHTARGNKGARERAHDAFHYISRRRACNIQVIPGPAAAATPALQI